MLLIPGTGNGERGTGNGERGTGNGEPGKGVWEPVHSGNPYKNSKWRTKTRKKGLGTKPLDILCWKIPPHPLLNVGNLIQSMGNYLCNNIELGERGKFSNTCVQGCSFEHALFGFDRRTKQHGQ